MKGALFDLDGVIADTAVFHFKAWRKLIKDHFGRELPDEVEEQTKGVSRTDSLKAILNFLKIEVSPTEFDQLAAEKNDVYRSYLETLTAKDILPGMTQLLTELKEHGVKLALASASQNGPFILDKLGIAQDFDAIADPSKVAKGKPAPDIYLVAAAALNLNPQDCVGFEDAIAGVQAINDAHAVSIGIGNEKEVGQAARRFDSTADVNYSDVLETWSLVHKNL